jgi:phage-related protein
VTSRWEVIFYEDQDGHSPVQEYILEDNDPKKIAILIAVIQRLESVGADLQGTNMDKQIEGPIRELRKNRHRILYGRDGDRFILLTAFLKKTKKTPRMEIELAKARFQQYLKEK